LTLNKVFISILSILFSAGLLSLNFVTVSSGDAPEGSRQEPVLVEKQSKYLGRDLLEYAQVSPEVAYVHKIPSVQTSDVLGDKLFYQSRFVAEQQSGQEGNFGFHKIQFTFEGGTVQLQAAGSGSSNGTSKTLPTDVAAGGQELALRQDFYLDDPQLHRLSENSNVVLEQTLEISIPAIEIQYDRNGNYDARKTWSSVDRTDLLARAMLAEENEKLYDLERELDFVGAGWVMVNRTLKADGFFNYADENLYGALVPYFQFALGGTKDINGTILPGNAAIVANPELYPGWFAGNPRGYYQKAYRFAAGILNGTIPDPTGGAIYFADFYVLDDGSAVPFEDGRTRFWSLGYPSFSLPELHHRGSAPWSSN
jgi:hypothetical protein